LAVAHRRRPLPLQRSITLLWRRPGSRSQRRRATRETGPQPYLRRTILMRDGGRGERESGEREWVDYEDR
jgi:hypothetical protein